MTISTVYLKTVFYPDIFPRTVENAVSAAKMLKQKYNYDTIAFSGMSGAAMSFLLAHQLKVPLLCVRKKDDGSHFWGSGILRSSDRGRSSLEGYKDAARYLLVDDFISSGNTVRHIMSTISSEIPTAECMAMLMYAGWAGTVWPPSSYEGSLEGRWPKMKSIEVVCTRPENID